MEIFIREYQSNDLKTIERLMDSFEDYLVKVDDLKRLRRVKGFGKKYTAFVFKNLRKNNGKMFVALDGTKVIGFIAGVLEEQSAEDVLEVGKARYGRILEFYVDESYRGKGIGGRLVTEMERYLKKNKCQYVSIEVLAPNKNAHEVYTHLGYVNRSVDLIKKVS